MVTNRFHFDANEALTEETNFCPRFWAKNRPKYLARRGRVRARGASTPESRCARGPPCTRTRSRFEAPSCRGKVHRVACKMWRLPMLGACAPAQVTLGACRRVRRASRTARTACLTCLSARPVRKSRYVSPVSPSPSPEHSSRTPSREPPTHARRRLRHIRYVHPPPSWGP